MAERAVCILCVAVLLLTVLQKEGAESQNPKLLGPWKMKQKQNTVKSNSVTPGFDLDSTLVPAQNSSNETCAVRIADYSFPSMLKDLMASGTKLIFLRLQIDEELSDDVRFKIVQPLTWILASEKFGTNVLLLRETFPIVVYRYIELGVAERTVTLKSIPTNCLSSLCATGFKTAVLNGLFNEINNVSSDDTVMENQICTLVMRPKENGFAEKIAEFVYECHYKLRDNTIKSHILQSSQSMQVLSNYHYIAMIVLFLFIVRCMIPEVSDIDEEYEMKSSLFPITRRTTLNEETYSDEETLETAPLISDSNTSRNNLLCLRKNDFVAQDKSPVALKWLIFDNLLFCKQRDNKTYETCCHASPCVCVKTFVCQWHLILSLIMKTLFMLIVLTPFFLRLYIFFFIFNTNDLEYKERRDFAYKHDFKMVYNDVFLTNVIMVIAYIVTFIFLVLFLIDILWTGKLNEFIRSVNEEVDEINNSNHEHEDEIKHLRKRLSSPFFIITYFFEKCGLFVCFALPLCVIVSLLHALWCKTGSRLFCLVLYTRCHLSRTICKTCFKTTMIMLFYIVFSFVCSDILSALVANVFFCVIVVITDKSDYIVVISFLFAVIFYVLDLFSDVKRKYKTFHSLICSYIRDNVIIKENVNGPRIIFIRAEIPLIATSCERSKIEIQHAIPVMVNSNNKQFLSHAFFLDAIEMNVKGVPGSLSVNLLMSLCHFLFILLFLIFVMLVFVSFGDNFSDTHKILVLLATYAIPHFVYNARKNDKLDLKDRHFQKAFINLINDHEEVLYVQSDGGESSLLIAHIDPGSIYRIGEE